MVEKLKRNGRRFASTAALWSALGLGNGFFLKRLVNTIDDTAERVRRIEMKMESDKSELRLSLYDLSNRVRELEGHLGWNVGHRARTPRTNYPNTQANETEAK